MKGMNERKQSMPARKHFNRERALDWRPERIPLSLTKPTQATLDLKLNSLFNEPTQEEKK